MNIKIYSREDKDTWDYFVKNSKNSHFMFLRDYIEYHSDRFQDMSLVIQDDSNNWIGILPGNIDNNILYSHQGLSFGGLCIGKKATTALVLEMFDSLLKFLKSTVGAKAILYKRIPDFYASYPSQEDLYALFINKASLIRRDVNVIIDMDDPYPFSKMRNRRIKKALKEEIEIEEIFLLDKFWDLLNKVLKANHGAKPAHSLNEMQSLKDSFPENIRCFVGKKNKKIIAGTLVFINRNVVHTQYLASNEEGRSLSALDIVINHLVNNVFNKMKYFSFGISTENDGLYLNNGLINQKESFGARAIAHDFYRINI